MVPCVGIGLLFSLAATGPAYALGLFSENFDALLLGPTVSSSEVSSPLAWTQTGPAGWVVDDSGVPTVGIPNASAVEFEGWSFVDKQWWASTAVNQRRSEFTLASGNVAVADPDEWDDFGTPAPSSRGTYSARLLTPFIGIENIAAGGLKAYFHSSWRPEGAQTATVRALYNDPASTVVEALRYESAATSPRFKADAPNEEVTINLLNPAGATSVQLEFRLFDARNNWWWAFDNLQLFTGAVPGTDEVLRTVVNRDTGSVRIVNNTGAPVDLTGYSITSAAGTFDEVGASYRSHTDPQWLRATRFDDALNDVSEVHLSSHRLEAGASFELGNVWGKYFLDQSDVAFSYSVAGAIEATGGLLEFVGNGGASFPYGDLDFDGQVDLSDWDVFKASFPVSLAGRSTPARYALGDLNADGRHTATDFVQFEAAYDAANGAGAFAAALATPEPAGAILLLTAGVFGLVSCRRRLGKAPVLLLSVLAMGGVSEAQLVLFEEDFEGLPLAPPIEEAGGTPNPGNVVTRTAPAGWVRNDTGVPGLGNPSNDGVVDWAGWSFANRDWWATVDNQRRNEFTRASGTVMVADSDEWDDATNPVNPTANPSLLYNARIRTPTITIPAGLPANRLQLAFDSSWRDEANSPSAGVFTSNQTASIRAYYNGSAVPVEVLRWESIATSPFFRDENLNEAVLLTSELGFTGAQNSVRFEFALTDADNNWWWAIDNVWLTVPAGPARLRVNTFDGEAFLVGDVIPVTLKSIDIASASGALTGQAAGLATNAGDFVDGPDGGTTAGNSSGERWEQLESTNNRLFEAFLIGSSTFPSSRTTALGRLFERTTPEASRDLAFSYTNLNGEELQGLVEYYFDSSSGLPGDANADGSVDLLDLDILGQNFGLTGGASVSQGDFNSDGDVDLLDLDILGQNFGAGAAVAVPEPSGVGLAAALMAFGVLFTSSSRGLVRDRGRASSEATS